MHVNKTILIGRVGERGPKLTYNESAVPCCAFMLEVDEITQSGKTFTSYLPIEVTGKYAESCAEKLEAGQEVLIDGKLAYRKIPGKNGAPATSKLVVSTWNVSYAPTPAPAGKVEE